MSRIRAFWCHVGLLLLLGSLMGCTPTLPTLERPEAYATAVTGVVTLDGQPLADAQVLFIPIVYAHRHQSKVPVAFAKTDSEGKYSLSYPIQGGVRSGAHLGRYTVLISKVDRSNRTSESSPAGWRIPFEFNIFRSPRRTLSISQEQVPVRYNLESQLTAEIVSTAEETIDFHLEN